MKIIHQAEKKININENQNSGKKIRKYDIVKIDRK